MGEGIDRSDLPCAACSESPWRFRGRLRLEWPSKQTWRLVGLAHQDFESGWFNPLRADRHVLVSPRRSKEIFLKETPQQMKKVEMTRSRRDNQVPGRASLNPSGHRLPRASHSEVMPSTSCICGASRILLRLLDVAKMSVTPHQLDGYVHKSISLQSRMARLAFDPAEVAEATQSASATCGVTPQQSMGRANMHRNGAGCTGAECFCKLSA